MTELNRSPVKFLSRGLCALLATVFASVVCSVDAQVTLSVSGVNEGAAVVLAPAVSTTNLSVTGNVAGAAGAQSVYFALEVGGSVSQRKTSGPPYAVTFTNLSAGKYFLSAGVQSAPAAVADVSFDIASASLQPSNDLWSQAAAIPAIGNTVTSTNLNAGKEPGEPVHADNGGGRSVWWKWTAPSNGTYTATTMGSGFDTVLGVYRGTNVATLIPVGFNDDCGSGTNTFSQATFVGSTGTNYYFAVDGAMAPDGTSPAGTVQLKLLAAVPPSIVIGAPLNGLTLLVAQPSTPTNVTAAATVSDPSGLTSVDYVFNGGPGVVRAGLWTAPYQLPLTNLVEGDYLLTVTAVNNFGLVATAHAGLTVASIAPQILLGDATEPATNGFKFALTGRKGLSYSVESSSNLTSWSSVSAWTNFDGVRVVTDTNSPQAKTRFYRAGTPQ